MYRVATTTVSLLIVDTQAASHIKLSLYQLASVSTGVNFGLVLSFTSRCTGFQVWCLAFLPLLTESYKLVINL